MHSRLSSLLLIVLSICFLFVSNAPLGYCTDVKLLGRNYYLKSSGSGIGDYRLISFVAPSGGNRFINVTANSTGAFLIGGWVSPVLPVSVNLSRDYNFLFNLFAKASVGNASLFARFFLYRGGSESLLFTSGESCMVSDYVLFEGVRVKQNVTGYLWQYSTSMALSFLAGDRVVVKFYFLVYDAGSFGFGYDCASYPSYFTDPVETRYFRNDKVLNTTQTASYALRSFEDDDSRVCLGVKVYVGSSCISGSVPVALVVPGSVFGYKSNSWVCPAQSVGGVVMVEVYACTGLGLNAVLMEDFVSTESNICLNASTWMIYYYCRYFHIGGGPWFMQFRFGASTANMRIENFSWTVLEPPIVQWNNVTSWTFQIVTRQWGTINTWTYQLLTRSWTSVSTWTFQLNTMDWHTIASWIFGLDSRGWHTIATWYFLLESSPEIVIVPILFIFGVIGALLVLVARKKRKEDSW